MVRVPELCCDPVLVAVVSFEELRKSLANLNLVLIHVSAIDMRISLVQSLQDHLFSDILGNLPRSKAKLRHVSDGHI